MKKYKILGDNKKEDFLFEIFQNRGFKTMESVLKYITTSDNDINNYMDLDNIEEACQLLKKHLDNNGEILHVIDCDVDGLTSSSILANFIREVKKDAKLKYVMHESKQHGLSNDLYENVYDTTYDLIIIPDAGSNDYECHKKLKEMGIDILILDHHEAPKYSEYAITINNQLSAKYKNKSLSGVGIVWQFIRCFNDLYDLNIDVNKYLDLVALGNVSDIMDLRSIETKHLVMKGLKNINNPFFKTACKQQEYSLKGKITPEGVGWYIGPYINAMIRVGNREDKEILFKSMLSENSYIQVKSTKRGSKEGDVECLQEQAFRLCSNARNKQNKMVDEGMKYIEEKIEKENLTKNKILLIKIPSDKLIPEIVGLIANKIASKYQQPTLILRENEEYYSGSARNFNYSPLNDFRKLTEESGLAEYATGHPSAHGVCFKKENIDKYIKYTNEILKNMNFEQCIPVDFEFDMNNKESQKLKDCLQTIGSLNEQGFWGQGIKEPLIAIKNISIQDVNIYIKKTITGKITDNNDIEYMKFNSNEEELEELKPKGFQNKAINLIGRVNVNDFRGRKTYQVFIEDYEKIKYNNNVKKWNF